MNNNVSRVNDIINSVYTKDVVINYTGVNPDVYYNSFKITTILLIIVIIIAVIGFIKGRKKYCIMPVIISVIMTIISYLSYNFISKNIGSINGDPGISCGLQSIGSFIAIIVNSLVCLCILCIVFYKGKSKKEENKNDQENS